MKQPVKLNIYNVLASFPEHQFYYLKVDFIFQAKCDFQSKQMEENDF